MWKSATHIALLLTLIVVTCILLTKQYNRVTEEFVQIQTISATNTPADLSMCSSLMSKMDENDESKGTLSKKVSLVKNDGSHFRYFNDDKKTFDGQNYEYCYVNVFDQNRPDGAPPCSKSQPQYQFPMIQSVEMGAVQEPGKTVPQQVCIMELNPKKVLGSDVREFAKLVDTFESKNMASQVQGCQSDLKDTNVKYSLLLDEYHRMQGELNTLYVEQEQCAAQKSQFLQQNVLLNAAAEAGQGVAVLIDTRESYSRLSFDVSYGTKPHAIAETFRIAYVFLPKGYRIRFIKANGVFVDFDGKSPGYPLVDPKMSDQVTSVRFIPIEGPAPASL